MQPSPSHVWLALCHRNIDVSWALLATSIPDLVIRQGISLPVPIHFEFGSGIALGWKEWVDRELSDAGFMGLLQQAVVLKAIIYLTIGTSSTSTIWSTDGVPPFALSSSSAVRSP